MSAFQQKLRIGKSLKRKLVLRLQITDTHWRDFSPNPKALGYHMRKKIQL